MIFEFEDHVLDDSRASLFRRGRRIKIERNALSMLVYLLRHRHRVVLKEELFKAVWGGAAVSESSLPRCMNALRLSLSNSAKNNMGEIRTVYGLGYQFVGSVQLVDAATSINPSSDETRAARSRQILDLRSTADLCTTPTREKALLGLKQGILETKQGLFSSARKTLLHTASLARRANEVETMAHAAIALAGTFLAVHRTNSLVNLLEDSIVAVGTTNPELSLELKAERAVANMTISCSASRRTEARKHYLDAIGLDNPHTSVRVLALSHRTIEGTDSEKLRRLMSAHAISETNKLANPRLKLEARYPTLSDCLISADIEGFESSLSYCVDLARELDENIWFARLELAQAVLEFLAGQYDASTRSRMRALEFLKNSPEDFCMMDRAHGWMVSRERPENTARPQLPIFDEDSHQDRLTEVSTALGMCYVGRREHAVRLIERMPNNWLDTEVRNHLWTTVVAFYAELAFLVDDRHLAARALAELPANSRSMVSMGTSICAEPIDYFRGLALTTMKLWESAEKCFAHAFEFSRRLRAIGFQARIAYAWGVMLSRQCEPHRLRIAHAKATYAFETAERLGMSRLRSESALLLVQLRQSVDSRPIKALST